MEVFVDQSFPLAQLGARTTAVRHGPAIASTTRWSWPSDDPEPVAPGRGEGREGVVIIADEGELGLALLALRDDPDPLPAREPLPTGGVFIDGRSLHHLSPSRSFRWAATL